MLSPESIELLKKNQVLFSIDEFIPSNNEPFNPVEFVQSYRRRVYISVLKEELKKLSKLIDYLISQEINVNYESFIKYSEFLGEVKKQINVRMESLGDNTDEIPILSEFYDKVVKSIRDSELFLHKSEIYSHLKEFAKNTRHLYSVLFYNLREWYREFKESKDIIFFDQISLSLKEFHQFFHGELEVSQNKLKEIMEYNRSKFKYDQGEPDMVEVRKRVKRVGSICEDCYSSYSQYYNMFKSELRFYFLKYAFAEDIESLRIVVRSIGKLHLFRWVESIILQDIISKKIEVVPPRRIVGAKYLYDFDQLKQRMIATFKTPLFDAIDSEGLSKEFKLFDNVIMKYLSDFIFFNPRFKFLYSLIDEKNFHSHYHSAINFLRELCEVFHGDWELTASIRKKWSVRLYFISNKKKMMEKFEDEVDRNFGFNDNNNNNTSDEKVDQHQQLEIINKKKKRFHFGLFQVLDDLTQQLFSPSVYIEAKGKEFFTFFLSLLSRFNHVVNDDDHILFHNILEKSREEDLISLLNLRLDSQKLENLVRKEWIEHIHSATKKNLELVSQIMDEWITTTFFKQLVPKIDDLIREYILLTSLKEFSIMKTHYMSIATSDTLPNTPSGFVIRIFTPIDLTFLKSKEMGVSFSPKFKKSVIRRILERYQDSYNGEVEGYKKRRRMLVKLRKHQRSRSRGGEEESEDDEEEEGVKRILEQIRIDNEEIWKWIEKYLPDEDEREELKIFLK